MTVKELIEALKVFDPEVKVCLGGYEGGYTFLKHVQPVVLLLDCNKEWYYGPHGLATDEWQAKRHPQAAKELAIYLR